jgi:hypothetical protein
MTFGRGDFAASIGLRGQEDSLEVMLQVEQFVNVCRQNGLVASVGGNMRQGSLAGIAEMKEPPDRLEGRRGIWNWSNNIQILSESLSRAIEIELAELHSKMGKLSGELGRLQERELILKGRLED